MATSSITESSANRFLKSANDRDVLSCKKITGLSLIKLNSGGSWRWRYKSATGKRRVVTIDSFSMMKPEQAANQVQRWKADNIDPLEQKGLRREQALSEEEAATKRKLGFYLDNHYKAHMKRSWKQKNATANYNRIAKQFESLIDRDMSGITDDDIKEWRKDRESKGAKHATIKRDYGSLTTMINDAVRNKVITENPLKNYKLAAPSLSDQESSGGDKAKRRMLTRDEVSGILNGLDRFSDEIRQQRRSSRTHGKPELPDLDKFHYPHWFVPFCHLALHTGMRVGDLYTLTWQELNIQFGRLIKETQKSQHAKRHGKQPVVIDLTLNKMTQEIMGHWHEDMGKPIEGLVFPSPRNGNVMTGQAHRNPWNQVKALGEIDSGLDFYSLRHHFISATLSAGVSVFTVAKLAGHKGVDMILEHYGHLCPDRASEALDIVATSLQQKTSLSTIDQAGR